MILIIGNTEEEPRNECEEKFREVEERLLEVGLRSINGFNLEVPLACDWREALLSLDKLIKENVSGCIALRNWADSLWSRSCLDMVIKNGITPYYQIGGGVEFLVKEYQNGYIRLKKRINEEIFIDKIFSKNPEKVEGSGSFFIKKPVFLI